MTKKQLRFIVNDIVTPDFPKNWLLNNLEKEKKWCIEQALSHPRMIHFYQNGKYKDCYVKVEFKHESLKIVDYLFVRTFLDINRTFQFEVRNAVRKVNGHIFMNKGYMSDWSWHNKFNYYNPEDDYLFAKASKHSYSYKHQEKITSEYDKYKQALFDAVSKEISPLQWNKWKDWPILETAYKEGWLKLLMTHGITGVTKSYKQLILHLIPPFLLREFKGSENGLYELFELFIRRLNRNYNKSLYEDYLGMCKDHNWTYFDINYKQLHDNYLHRNKIAKKEFEEIIKSGNFFQSKLEFFTVKTKKELKELGEENGWCIGRRWREEKIKNFIFGTYEQKYKICCEFFDNNRIKEIAAVDNEHSIPQKIKDWFIQERKKQNGSRKITTNR